MITVVAAEPQRYVQDVAVAAEFYPHLRQRRLLIGGIILARVLEEKEGLQILDQCRSFVRRSLADELPRRIARRSPRRARAKGK